MNKYKKLIEAVKDNGQDVYWYGSASVEEVDKIECLLKVNLPSSYREFLCGFGGGGVIDADISGIEDDDGDLNSGGTTYGDTLLCREEYELPNYLVVVFYKDDEICWCLDTSRMLDMECLLVSYNIFKRVIENDISSSFEAFFVQYLELRAS